jgi:nucleoside-diphosphate-sugar epimerase
LDSAPAWSIPVTTALPAGGPTKASDLEPTNRLRRDGTANLLAAAVAAGARRLVAESMVLVHGFGDFGAMPLTEAEPLRPPGPTEAALVGDAPPPPSLPLWLARLMAPFGSGLLTTRLPVSNAKARRELGWAPAFPTYREGLAELPGARTGVTSDW